MRLAITFSFVLVLSGQAQDYVLTTRGDTLRGNISFQLIGKLESVLIKATKRETLPATQVREVWMKGKQYIPVQFNESILFMQVMTNGYLSLLAFQPPAIMSYDGRLLQKRDGAKVEVPSLGFKKVMAKFLSDAPAVAERIQADELERKDLDEIIRQYNVFIESKSVTPVIQPTVNPVAVTPQQQSKVEVLMALKSEIEKSDLPLKQDAIDILNDWDEKLRGNKSIPSYMRKALRFSLGERNDLIAKVDELLR